MTDNIVLTLRLEEGLEVETVFYGSGTLCISTQAGCYMACPFCASGRAGLMRNLTLGELFQQLKLHEGVKRVTLSGIGEPLDNFDIVAQFIAESKLPVSVTTSVPDVDLMQKLILLPHNGVMLSLHAGTEKIHKKFVPKACSLDETFAGLADVWANLSNNKKRKIGFNYLLFKGVNDTEEEIDEFMKRVSPFKEGTIHLLHCNHIDHSSYVSPDESDVNVIYDKIKASGLNVRRANTWRKSRIGGCGTLFLKGVKKYLD